MSLPERWIARAAGLRDADPAWARGLLVVSGVLYLFVAPHAHASTLDWVVAALAIALVPLAAAVPPSAVAAGQAVVLATAEVWGTVPAVIEKVAAAAALVEVGLRCRRPWTLAAAGLTAAAYVAGVAGGDDTGPAAIAYRVAVGVAGPLLLAAYLRSVEAERRAAAARADDAERRREMAERVARQAERTAIARELHDVVAHHMASMVLRVGVARHVLARRDDTGGALGAVLDDVHGSATTALHDVKQLLVRLRDDAPTDEAVVLDGDDLAAALDELVTRARSAGLDVRADIDPRLGCGAGLGPLHALTVLRVVQEGLTNAARHGRNDRPVEVAIAPAAGAVTVRIRNDRAAGRTDAEPGHGLLGMHERAELVGGSLHSGPCGTDAWLLTADLPVEAATVEAPVIA